MKLHIIAAAIAMLGCQVFAQAQTKSPKAEIRAVWFTTNGNLDWPSSRTNATAQKRELTSMLDKLQAANFNTVIFQAQVKGDVAWKSSYQPAMYALTGNGSKGLSYDVAKFVVDECHKRDMECHAWIVPYRIGSANEAKKYESNPQSHPLLQHPEWCVEYSGSYYLNPGLPEVREYLIDVYRELVADYDFDGVSFDYTRYPTTSGFPDSDTYEKYNTSGLSLEDWRRDNVNTLVAEFYDMAKGLKPDFKVGSAPIGTYQNLPGFGNMTAYGVFQDPVQWIMSGHHDLIVPQLYYNEKYGFEKNMYAWGDWINGGGAGLAIGIAPYKMNDGVNDWDPSVVYDQIEKIRKCDAASGLCFFRTEHVIGDTHHTYQTLYDELVDNYFRYPAHIPSIERMGLIKPEAPTGVTQVYENGRYIISWDEPADGDAIRYHTVYLSNDGATVDMDDPDLVVAHKVHGTTFEYDSDEPDLRFAVTVFNKNYCESEPSLASSSGVDDIYAQPSQIEYAYYTFSVNGSRPIDRVELYSISGLLQRVVGVCGGSVSVECGELSPGVYIVAVKYADGGRSVHKIVR